MSCRYRNDNLYKKIFFKNEHANITRGTVKETPSDQSERRIPWLCGIMARSFPARCYHPWHASSWQLQSYESSGKELSAIVLHHLHQKAVKKVPSGGTSAWQTTEPCLLPVKNGKGIILILGTETNDTSPSFMRVKRDGLHTWEPQDDKAITDIVLQVHNHKYARDTSLIHSLPVALCSRFHVMW